MTRRWRLGVPSLGALGDTQREHLELGEQVAYPLRVREPVLVALELLVRQPSADGLAVDLAAPLVIGTV